MSDFAGKEFLDQATQSLQGGQLEQALEFAENALALAPDNPDAYVLKGIAQSQLSRPGEALESFQKAIELAPQLPKAHFNLAVHYYGLGQKSDALASADKAVECDPSHTGAIDLANRLRAELNISQPSVGTAPVGELPPVSPAAFTSPPAGAPYREGYMSPVHSLRWVENMGGTWDLIGWVLTAASLLVFVVSWAVAGPAIMKVMQEAFSSGGKGSPPVMPDLGTGMLVVRLAGYAVTAGMLGWMIVELIDRRGPWLWLLPYIVCCCCGLQGIVNGIYLLLGRSRK
jgi:hypothetical protein